MSVAEQRYQAVLAVIADGQTIKEVADQSAPAATSSSATRSCSSGSALTWSRPSPAPPAASSARRTPPAPADGT